MSDWIQILIFSAEGLFLLLYTNRSLKYLCGCTYRTFNISSGLMLSGRYRAAILTRYKETILYILKLRTLDLS